MTGGVPVIRNSLFGALGGKDRFFQVMRWIFYFGLLLIFYMIMAGGFFRDWQPILIIPLAIAVAMRSKELTASLFGAICGLVLDIACGRLFGFSGIWLLPGCLAAALLSWHLIKINLLNFIWINAAICTIMAFADYFFRYLLWGTDNSVIILTDFILPSHLSAILLSPLVYFAVKIITIKLSPTEQVRLSMSSIEEEIDEESYK